MKVELTDTSKTNQKHKEWIMNIPNLIWLFMVFAIIGTRNYINQQLHLPLYTGIKGVKYIEQYSHVFGASKLWLSMVEELIKQPAERGLIRGYNNIRKLTHK